jgi:hypothetical protein
MRTARWSVLGAPSTLVAWARKRKFAVLLVRRPRGRFLSDAGIGTATVVALPFWRVFFACR